MRMRARTTWCRRARRRLWATTLTVYTIVTLGWWHCAAQPELRSTIKRYRAYVAEREPKALNYLPTWARKP